MHGYMYRAQKAEVLGVEDIVTSNPHRMKTTDNNYCFPPANPFNAQNAIAGELDRLYFPRMYIQILG